MMESIAQDQDETALTGSSHTNEPSCDASSLQDHSTEIPEGKKEPHVSPLSETGAPEGEEEVEGLNEVNKVEHQMEALAVCESVTQNEPPCAPEYAAHVVPSSSTQYPRAGATELEEDNPEQENTEHNPGEISTGDDHPPSVRVLLTVHPHRFRITEMLASVDVPCAFLYQKITRRLHVPRSEMKLTYRGSVVRDEDLISELLCEAPLPRLDACVSKSEWKPTPSFGAGYGVEMDIELERIPSYLTCLEPDEELLCAFSTDILIPRAHMPDEISELENPPTPPDAGSEVMIPHLINIVMVRSYTHKPFLGGYRNKQTGFVYHDAFTQTPPPPLVAAHAAAVAAKRRIAKWTRATQTLGVTRSVQTARECFTQMERPDFVVGTDWDRTIVAKEYFTADALRVLRVEKAIRMQAFVRGCFARKRATALREEQACMRARVVQEHQVAQRHHEEHATRELRRRLHPKTRRDFALLYDELEAWRLQETARVHEADITPHEKQLAFQELLRKETLLLQKIDQLKVHAQQEQRQNNTERLLQGMKSGKQWGEVQIETPGTVRARALVHLYEGLTCYMRGAQSVEERLNLLLQVKWTVQASSPACNLTRDLIALLDREADLLGRGRHATSLNGLRQRIRNLFLQFIEDPKYNPEAAAHNRVLVGLS